LSEVKKEEQKQVVEEKRENLVVQVNRSNIEKELQSELEKKEADKTALNNKLLESEKMLKELQVKDAAKTTEYSDILKERDEVKKQLQEIALAKFNEVKTARLKTLQTAGLPEDKIKEFTEKIKTPQDLDEMDFVLQIIGDQFAKAQADRDKAKVEEEKKAGDPKSPESTPQNPPKGSTVKLPERDKKGKLYQNPREAVDDLYDRAAKGDKDAEKDLTILWKAFIPALKKKKASFGITQCPTCGAGILEGEKCWMCGFDPEKWKTSGGEIF